MVATILIVLLTSALTSCMSDVSYTSGHYAFLKLTICPARWRCLHRPTFERQNADLCIRLRSGVTEFTLDELSTLALYATCLCVGVHFLDEEAYRDLNIDQEGAVEMAASCWQVAQEALEASDWTQVNNVKSCQTIM